MTTKKSNKPVKNVRKVARPSKNLKKTPKKLVRASKPAPKSLKVKAKLKKPAKAKISERTRLMRIKASSVKRAANAKTKKLMAQKLDEQAKIEKHAEESKRVGILVSNATLLSTVSANVGSGSVDILKTLVEGPRTDESIAEKLNVKVNDVRRMLNVMNSYSIVRYDVNKDNKGWLIFTWRIDPEKLTEYVTSINKEAVVADAMLPGNCNDFFICKVCYTKEKTVLPFDSAFESDFSCGNCGKPFALLSREETVALFKTVNA